MKIKKFNQLNELLSPENEIELEQIICNLIDMEIDGESTQYLLEQIGMDDQMLSQLIGSYPKEAIQELVSLDDYFLESYKVNEFVLQLIETNSEFRERLKNLMIMIDANKYNL